MNDAMILRCLSLIAGVCMFALIAMTGVDGDFRATGAALIAFGLGIGIKSWYDQRKGA